MPKPFTALSKTELLNLIVALPCMDNIPEKAMKASCCICAGKTKSNYWYVCDKCSKAAGLPGAEPLEDFLC